MNNNSIVSCWTGARGSGKSLSMAYEIARALMQGQRVWSNLSIYFVLRDGDPDKPGSIIGEYSTLPLDMELLYTLDTGVCEGIIAIDEINLWADSWSTQNVAARLLTAVFQQIRKRKLSFYLTTQNFNWINNRIRWQTDLHIACFDYAHGHPGVEPGTLIVQTLYDMSGVFTGYPYSEYGEYENNVASRMFKGKPFWNIYDSFNEFDYSMMTTRYHLDKTDKVIKDGQVYSFDTQSESKNKIRFMNDCLRAEGKETVTVMQLLKHLNEYEIDTDIRHVGRELKQLGWNFKRSRKGDYYSLEN